MRASPMNEHQIVRAHALAALTGARVDERADQGLLRQDLEDHEHIGKHAAQEGAQVDAGHGPKAEVPPDPAEQKTTVAQSSKWVRITRLR
jgi:hypothetical protein